MTLQLEIEMAEKVAEVRDGRICLEAIVYTCSERCGIGGDSVN